MVKVLEELERTCFKGETMKKFWEATMDEEMVALHANHTWDFIALPQHKGEIGCKWIYKVKHNVNGCVSSYKARFVAEGYA